MRLIGSGPHGVLVFRCQQPRKRAAAAFAADEGAGCSVSAPLSTQFDVQMRSASR